MFEELNQHRAAVAEQIQKACEIGFTGGELEKAHNVGDVHPNGKWVWTKLPSGKYDWRVIKKTGAPSGGSAPATAQKTEEKKISIGANHPALASVPGVSRIKDALTTYNSKYTDLSKVELIKTPKGNWDLHYDGHRLGIVAGSLISDHNAAKMGWVREGTDDLTRSKREAEKKTEVKMPVSLDEAEKMGKPDVVKVNAYDVPNTLYGCKRDLEEYRGKAGRMNGYYGKIDEARNDLERAMRMKIGEGSYDAKSEEEKLKKIQEASDKLATVKAIEKRISKVQTDLKKLEKDFLAKTGNDFTEAEVEEWMKKYNAASEPAAVVRNTWQYAMGRIGSTSATIQVGKGKDKPFDTSRWGGTVPDWRPIGMLEYSIRVYYGSDPYVKVKKPVQSWQEIKDNLSDTENFTLYLYKHPKQ